MARSSKAKKRVRLKNNPSIDAPLRRNSRKAALEAQREVEESRTVHGEAHYQRLLASYEANNLEPVVLNGEPLLQYKPLFVKDPFLKKRMLRLIRKGNHFRTVCAACGVPYKTFLLWMQRGAEGYSPEYERFYASICKAEASNETKLLESLKTHQRHDWRAVAWEMERRHPEHWGKKSSNTTDVNINANITVESKKLLSDKVREDPSARELARKMIEGTEFGYSVNE